MYFVCCVFGHCAVHTTEGSTLRSINTGQRNFLPFHSGHFYSAPSSPLLIRGAPDHSMDTVSEFHAEAHRQLQVKDLPKVPTRRLERESNPRPFGWKLSTQPRRHHVPWPTRNTRFICTPHTHHLHITYTSSYTLRKIISRPYHALITCTLRTHYVHIMYM